VIVHFNREVEQRQLARPIPWRSMVRVHPSHPFPCRADVSSSTALADSSGLFYSHGWQRRQKLSLQPLSRRRLPPRPAGRGIL
jgi:hypothetical protein